MHRPINNRLLPLLANGIRLENYSRRIAPCCLIQSFHTSKFQLTTASNDSSKVHPISPVANAYNHVDTSKPHVESRETEKHSEQTSQDKPNEQRSILMNKIKNFVKKYGITGVVVYLLIYYLTWTMFYFALECKWIKAGDVENLVKKFGLEKHFNLENNKSKKMANIGLAWIMTKFTEPVRFTLTIMVTPLMLRLAQKILRR
jgi:hypothetical protein